jgi:hypothetical protein
LSKYTNYLFTKLNLVTEITKISEISCLSVTSEIFVLRIFFPWYGGSSLGQDKV